MINKDEMLEMIHQMDPHNVANIVREALDESGIEYTNGPGEIIFNGLLDSDHKKAHWEYDELDKHGNRKPRCSACGKYHLTSWSDHKKCNYCPNCGSEIN